MVSSFAKLAPSCRPRPRGAPRSGTSRAVPAETSSNRRETRRRAPRALDRARRRRQDGWMAQEGSEAPMVGALPSDPDRNLALELVRVTEAAAIAAGRQMGRGDKERVDQAAVDAMRPVLQSVQMDGIVVIGEGERTRLRCSTTVSASARAY